MNFPKNGTDKEARKWEKETDDQNAEKSGEGPAATLDPKKRNRTIKRNNRRLQKKRTRGAVLPDPSNTIPPPSSLFHLPAAEEH